MSYYLHHLPGRLRAKIPDLKHDKSRARALKSALETREGILSVTVSTFTGSVLIRYDISIISGGEIVALIIETGSSSLTKKVIVDEGAGMGVAVMLFKAVFGFALETAVTQTLPFFFGFLARQFEKKSLYDALTALATHLSRK
jgi:hypothetical protein